MRFLALTLFAALFVGLPLYLLNTLVLPELNALHDTYAHADQLVQAQFSGQR